jgi:hypothetical protein
LWPACGTAPCGTRVSPQNIGLHAKPLISREKRSLELYHELGFFCPWLKGSVGPFAGRQKAPRHVGGDAIARFGANAGCRYLGRTQVYQHRAAPNRAAHGEGHESHETDGRRDRCRAHPGLPEPRAFGATFEDRPTGKMSCVTGKCGSGRWSGPAWIRSPTPHSERQSCLHCMSGIGARSLAHEDDTQ